MRLIDADKFCEYCEDYDLCKGKHIDYCPERDSLARCPTIDPESLRPKGEWISVEDRLPTKEEDSNHRIVGVVNGYNGKTRFTDAEIFVRYCHAENAWWSDDYDIEGCTVEKFYVVPQPPKGD